ncbi:MAG: hypothetical protein IAG13_16210 [Deltaproteobacteria bacterium]|nr:hypothetical protein [Nannocystaceae bacterium]
MHPPRPIEDFVDILRALVDDGVSFAVIGGCAVGAYARTLGLTVLSGDLDICVTESGLQDVLSLAQRQGATIVSRPQPRGVAVAFIDWHGRELNALTGSKGLPAARVVVRDARELELRGLDLVVPLADAWDILANKLAVRRDKDLPHIEVLRRFAEEEVVASMRTSRPARARLAPANRLLDVLGATSLSDSLGERLIDFADQPPIRRFLVGRLATRPQVERVIVAAPADEREQLVALAGLRSFSGGSL